MNDPDVRRTIYVPDADPLFVWARTRLRDASATAAGHRPS